MLIAPPRIVISALKGGSGKTVVSLGLSVAWRMRGYRVAVFKKGPDFIDAGWLSFASGSACRNLDPFMMTTPQILRSFLLNSEGSDLSLIEGNRGLYDGLDLEGCCSTAELGRILHAPVVLIVDVTMSTRTVAALVMGCQGFDPQLKIAGVILNRVAGPRQDSLIRDALEHYCGLPVLGSIPKLKGNPFPERHMGLVPHLETTYGEKAVEWAGRVVEEYIDLEAIRSLAVGAGPLETGEPPQTEEQASETPETPPRIGIIRDRAFWFYYPENLEHLKRLGAILVECDSLARRELPPLDALYIGGGFPETQAQALSENRSFREALKRMIETGLPVYAECGGLMYLGESLLVDDRTYPMVGAVPVKFLLEKKPQGHGYTVMEVVDENPYYPRGEVLKGHEFHYSRALLDHSPDVRAVFKVSRGRGIDGERDGLCKKNLLATYTHLHAGGTSSWGRGLFRVALEWHHRTEAFSVVPKRGVDIACNLGYKKTSPTKPLV